MRATNLLPVTFQKGPQTENTVPRYNGAWTTADGETVDSGVPTAPTSAEQDGALIGLTVGTFNSAQEPVYAVQELDDAVVIYLALASDGEVGATVMGEQTLAVDLDDFKNNGKPVKVADANGCVYKVLPPVIEVSPV